MTKQDWIYEKYPDRMDAHIDRMDACQLRAFINAHGPSREALEESLNTKVVEELEEEFDARLDDLREDQRKEREYDQER